MHVITLFIDQIQQALTSMSENRKLQIARPYEARRRCNFSFHAGHFKLLWPPPGPLLQFSQPTDFHCLLGFAASVYIWNIYILYIGGFSLLISVFISLGFASGLPQTTNSVSQHLNSLFLGKSILLAQTSLQFEFLAQVPTPTSNSQSQSCSFVWHKHIHLEYPSSRQAYGVPTPQNGYHLCSRKRALSVFFGNICCFHFLCPTQESLKNARENVLKLNI